MDPNIDFLNRSSMRGEPNHLPEFSRADLLGLSVLLAFLAVVTVATSTPSNAVDNVIVSAAVSLALAVGAVVSFVAALSWSNSTKENRTATLPRRLELVPRPVPISTREYRDRRSRAA